RGLADDLQRTFGAPQSPLAVSDHGEIDVLPRDTTGSPQVGQGFLPPSGQIGSDTSGFTHRADPGRLTAGIKSMLVGTLRVFIEEVSCSDQVPGHQLRQEFRESAQLFADLQVQAVRMGVLRQLGSSVFPRACCFSPRREVLWLLLPAGRRRCRFWAVAVAGLLLPRGAAALTRLPPHSAITDPGAFPSPLTMSAGSETFPVSGPRTVAPLRSAVVSHVPSVNSQKRRHLSVAARNDSKMHVNSTVPVNRN